MSDANEGQAESIRAAISNNTCYRAGTGLGDGQPLSGTVSVIPDRLAGVAPDLYAYKVKCR